MHSKKKVWGIVVVMVLVLGFVFMQNLNKVPAGSAGTVKIGLSAALSGELAFIGEANRDAALLALEEINARDDLKNTYELVIEDDSFDPIKTSSVAQKFLSIDKVDAVISVGSPAGNVMAPIAQANAIPHIGMASDITVAEGEYSFIHWTRPQEEVDALIAAMQERDITKVAVLSANHSGWQPITDDFTAKADKVGISYVVETFNPGEKDFRAAIAKVQTSEPQIYLLNSFDPELGLVAKQIRELGISAPLTSVESFGLTTDLAQFEGQWFVDSAVPTSEFTQKFEAKYGKKPGPAAANVYDAMNLLVLAFEEATDDQKASGEAVAQELAKIKNYSGAFGKLSVSEEGAFVSAASVKVVKNGEVVPQE